jgi:hypothetical protein
MAISQFSFTKPGTDPSTAKFARDRQIAEALAQQSLTADPTQMVGNYAIRQTALNPLAKIAQALASRKIAERADTGEREYQQQMGQDRARMIAEAMRAGQGQEARPAIEAPPEELGGGPGRPDMPAQAPDPARTYMMLAGASDPALQQIGLQGYTDSMKPRVLGRTMVDGSGRTIAVDSTWQQEQDANRVARQEQAAAQREQRMQELQMRIEAEERQGQRSEALRRELAKQQQEHARLMQQTIIANRPPRQEPQPQIVQTDSGPMIMDRQGNARPVMGPDGQPVRGKSTEKALPTSAAGKLMENQQNLRRAEQALALVRGEDIKNEKGEVIMRGDPNATGWKGLIRPVFLNRMDPKGTDTRAAIADLESLVVHDRSGAAVTAAETPRLRPFIPNAADDRVTAEKKLTRFANEYRAMVEEATEFYQSSGYKVPTEALRGSGAAGSWDGTDRRKPTPGAPGSPAMKFDRDGNPVK